MVFGHGVVPDIEELPRLTVDERTETAVSRGAFTRQFPSPCFPLGSVRFGLGGGGRRAHSSAVECLPCKEEALGSNPSESM